MERAYVKSELERAPLLTCRSSLLLFTERCSYFWIIFHWNTGPLFLRNIRFAAGSAWTFNQFACFEIHCFLYLASLLQERSGTYILWTLEIRNFWFRLRNSARCSLDAECWNAETAVLFKNIESVVTNLYLLSQCTLFMLNQREICIYWNKITKCW